MHNQNQAQQVLQAQAQQIEQNVPPCRVVSYILITLLTVFSLIIKNQVLQILAIFLWISLFAEGSFKICMEYSASLLAIYFLRFQNHNYQEVVDWLLYLLLLTHCRQSFMNILGVALFTVIVIPGIIFLTGKKMIEKVHHRIKSIKLIKLLQPNQQGDEESQCPICLQQIGSGNPMVRLKCTHTYHSECIKEWVRTAAKCPLCMARIDDGPGE